MRIFIILFFIFLNVAFLHSQTFNSCNTAFAFGNVTNMTCTNMVFNIGGPNVSDTLLPIPDCGNGAPTTNIDEAWISFVAQSTTTFFEYTNANRDAAVYAYSGTCGFLTQLNCVDLVGIGLHTMTLTTVVGQTYYVRIIRESGTTTQIMSGSFCIYKGCIIPNAPTVSATSICSGSTATLNATGGTSYAWYSVASGGTEISTSANFTTPTLSTTTTYYVEAIQNGCTSARTLVTVTVTPTPNADFIANGNDLTATPSGLSYQWLLSGNPIVGANSSTYSILQDGSYSVIVIDGTCADTSAVQNIVYLALSNKIQSFISIYPNPAKSSIFVQNKSNEIYKVEMMDVLGQNIKSFVVNSDLSEFELTGLSSGLYFLKFTNQQNETFYHKFIKE